MPCCRKESVDLGEMHIKKWGTTHIKGRNTHKLFFPKTHKNTQRRTKTHKNSSYSENKLY
jgi:hypothetical protein